jgi:hypothetical protein
VAVGSRGGLVSPGVFEAFSEEVLEGFGDDGWAGALLALGVDFALVLITVALHVDPASLEIVVRTSRTALI